MAANPRPSFLQHALGGYMSLPYMAANAGNARAAHTVADYYRLHVIPALEHVIAARQQRVAPPVPLGFGQMFPMSRPMRPSRVEAAAASSDLESIRGYLLAQLRYSEHLQRTRPLLGGLPESIRNNQTIAEGKPLE